MTIARVRLEWMHAWPIATLCGITPERRPARLLCLDRNQTDTNCESALRVAQAFNVSRTAAVAFILTAGSLAILWFSDVPLGVPGEWQWRRIAPGGELWRDGVVGAVIALVSAAVYLSIVWLGAKRLVDCSRLETALWLGVLLCSGFGWLWFVQQSPTQENRLQKAAFVLYYRGSSGYFHEARYAMGSPAKFLADYEDKMREGDVLHVGTHPPGLFLAHRGLIDLCDRFPALTDFLNQTQPREVEQMFDEIAVHNHLLPRDRAALWLAALLTQLVGVATLLPIYWLVREDYSRETSWLTAALWPLVPALAVFLPKSDALYPCIGMAFFLCWHVGWQRQSVAFAMLAGVWLWCGMFLSLALMPVAAMAGLWTLWQLAAERSQASFGEAARASVKLVLGAAFGFSVGVVLLWVLFDFNSLHVWWLNFQNHAGFYEQYTRTYSKWLVVNLFELVCGVGVPVMVLAVVAGWKVGRSGGWRSKRLAAYVCCGVVWGLLWISGKNMGEAARLWLVIMPWPIWLSAGYFERATDAPDTDAPDSAGNMLVSAEGPTLGRWLPFGVLQAIACAATVLAVYGFEI